MLNNTRLYEINCENAKQEQLYPRRNIRKNQMSSHLGQYFYSLCQADE